MACTKNPKRFLFWRWNGECDDEIMRFGRFMLSSNHFIILMQCKHCGCQHKRAFVSESELLDIYKIPIEIIKEHRDKLF